MTIVPCHCPEYHDAALRAMGVPDALRWRNSQGEQSSGEQHPRDHVARPGREPEALGQLGCRDDPGAGHAAELSGRPPALASARRGTAGFQQQRAEATVRAAMASCAILPGTLCRTDPRRWRELPLMDKATLMDHFAGCNSRGIGAEEAMAVALRAEASRDFQPALRGITVGLSSGTSGHRGIFLVSPYEQAQWAGAMLARLLPELPHGLRVAFCLRSFSRLYQAVESPFLRLRYFDIAMEPDVLASGIEHYDPQCWWRRPRCCASWRSARCLGRCESGQRG